MPSDFRVVAIIAAFNEEDIIGQVVADLIAQGVEVYFMDHGSTDTTVAEVERYLGRGLIRIERFPEEGSLAPEDRTRFAWSSILKRKEALAREVNADWFIHHDADEFRESPWPDRSLRDAIRMVDAAGFNAIDFELFNFFPTHDRFRQGDDVRASLRFFETPQPFNRVQVKCWKKLNVPVDLATSGGHEAVFEGRRVAPVRFILRHYPIRNQAQGARKVFRDRRTRFVPFERAWGWHSQYDGIQEGHSFVRDAAELTEYDADRTRAQLLSALPDPGLFQHETDAPSGDAG